jgi:hypothetical protein
MGQWPIAFIVGSRKKNSQKPIGQEFYEKNKEGFSPQGSVQDTGVYIGKRAQKK